MKKTPITMYQIHLKISNKIESVLLKKEKKTLVDFSQFHLIIPGRKTWVHT